MKITGKALFIISSLVNLYLIVLFFGNVKDGFTDFFFNSDCLYLPSLYRDLVVDQNSLQGWSLNPSPNFFPEWPVYFLFNWLSGDFRIASFLYALFNFFGISLLITLVYNTAFKGITWLYLAYVNFAMSAFLLLYIVNGEYILSGLIMLSAFHNGVFISSLIGMWLFLLYLDKKNTYVIPGILFVLSLLGTLSDKLFLVFFTLPLLSTLVLWREQSFRPKLILAACWTIAGTIMGFLVFSLLERGSAISFMSASGRMFNFDKIPASFEYFTGQMWGYIMRGSFRAVIILISALALIVAIVISIHVIFSRKSFLPIKAKTGIILLTSFIVIVLLNPIINGTYLAITILRYNIHAFYIAITLLAVLLYYLSERWKPVRQVFLIIAIGITISQVVFAFSFQSPEKAFTNLSKGLDYYPRKIEVLDSLAGVYNLRNGISDYWYAKQTTFLSKNKLVVRSINQHLTYYSHVSNRKWFIGEPDSNRNPSPIFNFIIAGKSIDSEAIRQLFGTDIDTIYKGEPVVLKVPDFYFSNSTRKPAIN